MKPPIVITVFATCALAIVPVNFGQDMFATERAQDDASLALALQINAQSQIEARIAELQRQTELLQHQRETPERPKSTAELEGAERKPAVDPFNAESKFSYQPRSASSEFRITPTPAADQIAQLQNKSKRFKNSWNYPETAGRTTD